MKLTNNFSLSEFTKSQTASKLGIDNQPKGVQLANIEALCAEILQPLRDHYGKSIKISSGFRSPALNEAIKGAMNSQHMFGQAADIDTVNDNADLFFFIRHNLDFDQLIWEYGTPTNPDWIHVSFNAGNNRGSILRCEKVRGKTIYTKMV